MVDTVRLICAGHMTFVAVFVLYIVMCIAMNEFFFYFLRLHELEHSIGDMHWGTC